MSSASRRANEADRAGNRRKREREKALKRKRERDLIRKAGRIPKNRRGRAPTSRNNRVLIRDNTQRINDINNNIDNIQDVNSIYTDDYIGRIAFSNKELNGINEETGAYTNSYLEQQKYDKNKLGLDRESSASEALEGISNRLKVVDNIADNTKVKVDEVTITAQDSLNNTLLLASAVVGALGSSLDQANAVLLNAVFLTVQTIRSVSYATSLATLGAGGVFTITTGALAITALVIQSYKIRQNQQETANQLGQTASSLQALQVIGGTF